MLEIREVVKSFDKKINVVDHVNLHLKRGVLGLIGHNGAGKTTLMQMIATILKPTSGEIIFQGVDIVRHPNAIRHHLGFLPQDFGVYPNLSAVEFMQYFAALKGVKDPARIMNLLELVNLQDHAHRSAAGFSGGMRRRLGIAQALLNDPDILIVDEPTAGLDPEERLRFRNLLGELGMSKLVIMSTHIVSDVETVANELAIMRSGKLIAFSKPEELIANAQGQIWSAQVSLQEYEILRGQYQIMHAQKNEQSMLLRIAHSHQPIENAVAVLPSLEEALMAQKYAIVG